MRATWFLGALFVVTLFASSARAEPPPPKPVDLNLATVEQLDALPGLGRKRAEAIVEVRTKRPFRRTTELMRIRGIGPKLFVRLRPFVVVEEPPLG